MVKVTAGLDTGEKTIQAVRSAISKPIRAAGCVLGRDRRSKGKFGRVLAFGFAALSMVFCSSNHVLSKLKTQ